MAPEFFVTVSANCSRYLALTMINSDSQHSERWSLCPHFTLACNSPCLPQSSLNPASLHHITLSLQFALAKVAWVPAVFRHCTTEANKRNCTTGFRSRLSPAHTAHSVIPELRHQRLLAGIHVEIGQAAGGKRWIGCLPSLRRAVLVDA